MYEESTDRTLLQKILLMLLLALAIIFTILMAVVKSQPQVKWADGLLRPSAEGTANLYTGSIQDRKSVV